MDKVEYGEVNIDGQVRDAQTATVSSQVELRWPVHIEVRVSTSSNARFDIIRELVHQHVVSSDALVLPSEITGWGSSKTLADNVERIIASESACPLDALPTSQAELLIHVYQPSEDEPSEEMSSGNGPGDEIMAASVRDLPSLSLDGLWDSLIYTDDIKSKLLNYIYATVVFSDADVDFNIVSWNRVVLLHGPPGTGKTSLARALAQKISIRLSSRYSHSRLLEINSHSLFSRWFSESGKLVQKLFASVNDLCEEDDCFVVVLIDEVESLTAARAGAMAGTEPSDALRVVNALLTQLDKLRHKKNVLVMATSNLVKAIDPAFIDRADIVQYVDLPPREAIYEILRTCLLQLMKRGIVDPLEMPSAAQAALYSKTARDSDLDDTPARNSRERSDRAGLRLMQLSEECRGMSGRTLRRLPVLAHANYLGLPTRQPSAPAPSHLSATAQPCSKGSAVSKETKVKRAEDLIGPRTEVEQWFEAMQRVARAQIGERARMGGL